MTSMFREVTRGSPNQQGGEQPFMAVVMRLYPYPTIHAAPSALEPGLYLSLLCIAKLKSGQPQLGKNSYAECE